MNSLKVRLLVVEDETQIRRFLRAGLPENEFELIEAVSAKEGTHFVATYNPDIVLLDLGLPDLDGIEVVRRVREWSQVPIIVLSARGQEQDKISALDHGADDYLTKPFALGELQARIRVALRRSKTGATETESIFEHANLRIDYSAHLVEVDNKQIHLTPLEYKLLTTLTRNPDKVMTHKQLLSQVWGQAYVDQVQYLRVMMGQLRHKIEQNPAQPKFLTTESGVGYRFSSNKAQGR